MSLGFETVSHVRSDVFVFVVPTTKLEESLHFYRDSLGLELLEEWSDMGRGALLAASDHAQVELIEMADVPVAAEPRVGLGLQITGVDDVYARLTSAGAQIKAAPRERPWGMYGFGAFDPNGVPINVYEPTAGRDSNERAASRNRG
jgi:predicted enzyme related to lactoylglutathione lyase